MSGAGRTSAGEQDHTVDPLSLKAGSNSESTTTATTTTTRTVCPERPQPMVLSFGTSHTMRRLRNIQTHVGFASQPDEGAVL